MHIGRYHKKEIASRQIDTALRLFFENGDLFSVITLAGAAEEMLCHLLQQKGPGRGLSGPFRAVLEILRPGRRKEPEQARPFAEETELFVHMDPSLEAVFLLGRAIDHYQALCGSLSFDMLRFNRELRAKG